MRFLSRFIPTVILLSLALFLLHPSIPTDVLLSTLYAQEPKSSTADNNSNKSVVKPPRLEEVYALVLSIQMSSDIKPDVSKNGSTTLILNKAILVALEMNRTKDKDKLYTHIKGKKAFSTEVPNGTRVILQDKPVHILDIEQYSIIRITFSNNRITEVEQLEPEPDVDAKKEDNTKDAKKGPTKSSKDK